MADTSGMHRFFATLVAVASLAFSLVVPVRAAEIPGPLAALHTDLVRLAAHLPSAATAVEVLDLSTGYRIGYNAAQSMPAASTIKVPVMVEVFAQLAQGRFDLGHRVTLLARDKDYGSGELCDARVGSTYTVSELLAKMIDISDNTATNMLIRLVGRQSINDEMTNLGLERTRLHGDIRTAGWNVRQTLRSSPDDMVHLLAMMARRELVDEWSSDQMIAILEDDQFNTLLPAGLPDDVPVAHKTGSFFDTLNDVGIVYANDAPYVIAVMTTGLPSLTAGRSFFHTLSHVTFRDEQRLAQWRSLAGIDTFAAIAPINAPDVRYWENAASAAAGGGG